MNIYVMMTCAVGGGDREDHLHSRGGGEAYAGGSHALSKIRRCSRYSEYLDIWEGY